MSLFTQYCYYSIGKPKVKDESIAKIWTLSAQDIDDEEIVSLSYTNYSATDFICNWLGIFSMERF